MFMKKKSNRYINKWKSKFICSIEASNNIINNEENNLFNLHDYIMQFITNNKRNSMLLLLQCGLELGYDKSLYDRVFAKIFMGQFLDVKSMDVNLIPIFISLPKMNCKTIKIWRSNWRIWIYQIINNK